MGLKEWAAARQLRARERARDQAAAQAGARRDQQIAAANPMPPPSKTQRLSSDGRLAVVGESHYQPALSLLTGGRSVRGLVVWCALVPEPTNKFDRWAVRVDGLSHQGSVTVGYLDRENARLYQPVLQAQAAQGVVGICPATIFSGGEGIHGIWLSLARPESCVMSSQPPVGHVVLGSERQVAVTGEQFYHEALTSLHGPGKSPARHFATLRRGVLERGKNAGQATVEVVIDGHLVGFLTAMMAARYLPLIDRSPSCCEAAITKSEKRHEVVLRLPAIDEA